MKKIASVLMLILCIIFGGLFVGCNGGLPPSGDFPNKEQPGGELPGQEQPGDEGETPVEEALKNGCYFRSTQYEIIWTSAILENNSVIMDAYILVTNYSDTDYTDSSRYFNVVSSDKSIKFSNGGNMGTSTYVDDTNFNVGSFDGYPEILEIEGMKINLEGETTVEKIVNTKFSIHYQGYLVGEFKPEVKNYTSSAYKFIPNEEDNYSLVKSGKINNMSIALLTSKATASENIVTLKVEISMLKSNHTLGNSPTELSSYYRLVSSDKALKFCSGEYEGYSSYTTYKHWASMLDRTRYFTFSDIQIQLNNTITKERIEQTKFSLYRGSLLVGEFKVEVA